MALVVAQVQELEQVHLEQVQEPQVAVPVHLVTELDPARVQVLALAHLVQAHQAVGIQVQELLVVALVQVLAQVQEQELEQVQLIQVVAVQAPELPELELEHRVAVPVLVAAHLEAVPVAAAVQVVNYNNYSKTKNPVDSTGFFCFKPNH